MDPSFAVAVEVEFEMLHRVGQVRLIAVEAGLGQSPVEQRSGRSDEQLPPVLDVARLLADQDQRGVGAAGGEHDLGRRPVEITPATFGRRRPQLSTGAPSGTYGCAVFAMSTPTW